VLKELEIKEVKKINIKEVEIGLLEDS